MISRFSYFCFFTSFALVSIVYAVEEQPRGLLDVEWTEFAARQDLQFSEALRELNESSFISNGLMGSRFFSATFSPSVIQKGRQDMQANSMQLKKRSVGSVLHGQSRLPIGSRKFPIEMVCRKNSYS